MSGKVLALILLFQAFDQILSHNKTRPNILMVMSDAFVSLAVIKVSLSQINFKKYYAFFKKQKLYQVIVFLLFAHMISGFSHWMI